MIRTTALLFLLSATILPGCTTPGDPAAVTVGTPVDSIRPVEVELQRFRAGISYPNDPFATGATTREDLVRRFVAALETQDTAALDALVLDRAEFAYLYYPSSKYTREPYRLDPALLWFLIGENGHKGRTRALRRFGGRPFGYTGHHCDPEPQQEGENLLWTGCVLFASATAPAVEPGSTRTDPPATGEVEEPGIRLFGTIIERAGRFKFISYANPL